MSDYFEEEHHESWVSRMGKAILCLIFAPVFVFAGYWIITIAEKKRADSNAVLKSAQEKTIEIDQFSNANNNKLVLISDSIHANKIVKDTDFGIETNGLRLYRQVLTYQWKETKKSKNRKKHRGGSTSRTKTYDYERMWVSDSIIDSKKFKYPEGHENTVFKHIKKKVFDNNPLVLNDFTLNEDVVKKLNYFTHFQEYENTSFQGAIVDTGKVALCFSIQNFFKEFIENKGVWEFEKDSLFKDGKFVFLGKGTSQNPEIGDVKVIFWHIPNHTVHSIIAEQNNKQLQWHKVEKGSIFYESNCGWGFHEKNELGIVAKGKKNLKSMFSEAKDTNAFFYSFLLRLFAFAFILGGIMCGKYITIVVHDLTADPNSNFEHKTAHAALLLAYSTTMAIAGHEWALYNTMADLTVWDNYFSALILLMINSGYQMTVSVGDEEMMHGE